MTNVARIKSDAVLRLFENNLFDHSCEGGRHFFTYNSGKFDLKFNADWFSTDPSVDYDLKQVRQVLKKMADSATREEGIVLYMKDADKVQKVVDSMSAYGMQYDETDGTYLYVVDGKVLFCLELDYLIALIVDNPTMSVKDLLDGMKESAESELAAK